MTPTISPRKNSLSISLTESVVFLRSVDVSAVRSTTRENTPPSILRGLLILTLVKPTRISSIQVDLIGQSVTTWTEVPSARYPDIQEKINLYSATRTFFEAPRIPTGRRALSLEPGLSHYADEAEFINRRRPPSPSMARDPGHTHQFNSADAPRGRERARARLSEEESILQPTPPLESRLHSMPSLGSSSPSTSEDDDSVAPLNSTVDRLRAQSAQTSSRSAFEQRRSSTISPPPTTDPPYESRSLSRTSASISHLPLPTNLSRSLQHSSPAREGSRSSFDDPSLECSRSPSRGRMGGRFSFANVSSSILEAVRSVQGTSGERGHSRQRGESRDEEQSHPPSALLSHVEEAVVLDGNEQNPESSGDGWQEFKKGTYTFPISFAIPSHMPPTLQCKYGSISWRLKASVHRPGAFTPKLSATREVILVASPSEDNRDDTDNATIERFWEDQLQYMLSVSGRVFPIGGTLPMTLSLLPMAKVKVFKVLVQLEERVDYFFAFSQTARRKDPDRRFELLSLVSEDEDTPLLPLPQVVARETESALHQLIKDDDNLSEFMANLMGPGPWTLQMAVTVPRADGMLHCSNKNKCAPIEIAHTLKVLVRVQREDEQAIDQQTGKPKKYDIMMRTPVHILSHLSNAQHTALPCYSESLGTPSPPAEQCASSGNREESLRNPRRSVVLQSHIGTGAFRAFPMPEERPVEVDSLYERNVIFERLITGQQSGDGILPPAYCAEA